MIIKTEELSLNSIYHTLTQSIVPRPVAWVLSENDDHSHNLAPFSYFNAVASEPPLISISITNKGSGYKDTFDNILDRGHFVVHIADVDLVELMNSTSAPLAKNHSELEEFGIEVIEVEGWPLPRIVQSKIAMLCSTYQIVPLGNVHMIVGEIKQIFIDENIITPHESRLIIDPKLLNPVSRLGGTLYATLGQIIDLPRP